MQPCGRWRTPRSHALERVDESATAYDSGTETPGWLVVLKFHSAAVRTRSVECSRVGERATLDSDRELERFREDTDRMLDFFAWVALGTIVVSTTLIVLNLNSGFQYLYVQSTEPAISDDDSVFRNFVGLLREARESMIVYDDGDNREDSLYNDPRVINAVHQKLRDTPTFELRCLFNCDEALQIRKELQSQPQVRIRTRGSSAPAYEVHYKIIDGGDKAYLSRHSLGSGERKFKIVDCTNVSRRHRERVANTVLRRYKEHFEVAFASSKSAN